MEEIIRQEKEEEMQCLWINVIDQPSSRNDFVRGVVTRSGKKVEDGDDMSKRETEDGASVGGTDTPITPRSQGSRRKVTVQTPERERGNATGFEGVPASAPSGANANPSPISVDGPERQSGEGGGLPPLVTTQGEILPVWKREWDKAYLTCPTWRKRWEETRSTTEWPRGIRVFDNRMFLDERLCVPLCFQNDVIQENHEFLGHVGHARVSQHMNGRYVWADESKARQSPSDCSKFCGVWLACSRGETLKGPIESTPIPPAPMSSVSIDLFKMPEVLHEGERYNMMAVCVDRHSGWVVAIPVLEKGLTGAKLAKLMVRHQWRPFGVPSIVSSDQGSHFVSTWWSTLCSLLGIRQAFSQAYHHQANGRVERAGQQLMEVLRKLHAEQKINWVEGLPQVVDRLHDVRGETGLSPYQILFGRDRPLAGTPYTPPRECEDAQQFFKRMSDIDRHVAETLNGLHVMQAERINQNRKDMPPLKVGDKIWYRRPENSGEKTDSRWIGPGLVKAREGERSYLIEVKPGVEMKAHRSFLKLYQEPQVAGRGVPLFFHKRTEPEEDAMPHEWEVEKILGHRKRGNEWQFLTKWVGYADGEETWEPAKNFIHRISDEFVRYTTTKKVPINWPDVLRKCR